MKVLLVHGVGHCESNPDYYEPWKNAITTRLRERGFTGPLEFEGLLYDNLFEKHSASPTVYAAAVAELLGSAAWHSVGDPISSLLHPSRGLSDDVRWKVGMVAQLVVEDSLRTALCDLLHDKLTEFAPDLVMAHSLGSLVSYDYLHNDKRASKIANPFSYVTFGSQINNVFAHSKLFPGPIKVPQVKNWFHLFNVRDPVLTAPIKVDGEKFLQVLTPSDAGHDPIGTVAAPGYLNHPATIDFVWSRLAQGVSAKAFKQQLAVFRRGAVKPRRRALLVGINDYPDPANRLEGCVNDTFLVSALLQERGFDPEDIRVVLNERATAQGIRERLSWLLDGAGDGMERVFFYSGHGAQMPAYNAQEKVDHVDECLVPYDFAWTRETAVVDDDFFALYRHLPYDARFFAVFDCCHSGGMHRDGGPRVRGLVPPDDIRHRQLCWDPHEKMWRQRKMNPLNPDFGGREKERAAWMGSDGATMRLGRGMRARVRAADAYRRLPPEQRGPYLPVILEACDEGNLSYEYRDGVISYGAFTYAMVKNLRAEPKSSFVKVVERTRKTLLNLGFPQVPQLLGPAAVIRHAVPGA